jgi:hypothetical protein
VVLYNGDNRSVSSERITVEVHSIGGRQSPPPPPPEKHRIHLKKTVTAERPSGGKSAVGGNLSGQEAALMQELKERVEVSQGKVSKVVHTKNGPNNRPTGIAASGSSGREARRDNNDPLPPPPPRAQLPTSPQSSVSQRSSSHPYESLPGGGSSDIGNRRPVDRHASEVRRGTENSSSNGRSQMQAGQRTAYQGSRDRRQQRNRDDMDRSGGRDNRRSRSTGPLEMSRRLDSPAATGRLEDQRRSRRRSRSRGDNVSDNDERIGGGCASPHGQRQSRSRGRGGAGESNRLSSNSFRRQGSRRGESVEGPRRSRSRGQSPRDRSVSRRRGEGDGGGQRRRREFSPPSPEEAQATLEKMLSR